MRDPANALFDAACEVLDAARILHEQTRRRGVEEAVPATLACLQEVACVLRVVERELEAGRAEARRRLLAQPPKRPRRASTFAT
jgi:hypothetical protein